eukprot:TRINITY_DN248_c0_g1_i1.p1 TRINITY_DN248_c0_g1~~TRINITY_DN248_c0_g1_i1.p1  ORF type:complete len:738 (-),score=151.75 TRINITY_DN248_c0_g1_i1:460-2673(-)
MPPRAVRRPSTATALKKKPPQDPPIDLNKAEEPPIDDQEQLQDASPAPKDENEENQPPTEVYTEIDRSEQLDLEDNDPRSETEEDAAGREEEEEEDEQLEDVEGEEVEYEEVEEQMEGSDGEHERGEVDVEAEEHHDVVHERRKRKGFEIFVGGLDRDATEEDLKKVFLKVGEVTEVRLMKNPVTQKNKGFAFIRFKTVDQAKRAVDELKHPTVNGKQCGVSPSQDSDTLFVGNICKSWTKEALKEKLAHYAVDNFEDLTLVEDTKNEGMNRGFAFLDFPSRSDALEACKRLQKRDVVFGTDRTAKVAFADTFIEPDDEVMAQVKTVFVDGLPPTWDEERVMENLKKFGVIEKVELARNMPAAKRTDFAFITFETHDAALACAEGMNNAEVASGDKKVKVRARLSRPRQRGRSGKHTRGDYTTIRRGGGRGGRGPWGIGMPHTDSWRFSGRGGRDTQDRGKYGSGYKRPLGSRDRHPVMDVVPDRVGSRQRLPPRERSFDWRSPPVYGKRSSKRDYVQQDEPFPRSSDFAVRAAPERRLSYKDAYPSRGSGYIDSPPQSVSRTAGRRPPIYAEESYGRRMERPSSYLDSHTHDYGPISGTKRPHSATDDLHPRYADSAPRQSRTRYDYGGSSAALPYGDSAYVNDPTRSGRSSHVGYDGGSRSSAGYSHPMYETRPSSMGYSRGGASRGDAEAMYSSYDRDYVSSRADVGSSSYSSLYSSRDVSDGYVSGRGSSSYY